MNGRRRPIEILVVPILTCVVKLTNEMENLGRNTARDIDFEFFVDKK